MLSAHRPRWPVASVTLLGAILFAACALNDEGALESPSEGQGGASQGGAAGQAHGGSSGSQAHGGSSSGGASGKGGAGQGGTSSGGATGTGGTSAGGATGTGGTSSGGATGKGGASGGGVEQDCLDSADNDSDGKKDCEDSDCVSEGFGCTELPSGWQGFFRTRTGNYAGAAEPLACPGGTPASRRYLDPAGAAECSACTCTHSGAKCGIPKLACSGSDSTCYDTQYTFGSDCSTCCTVDTSNWPYNPYFSCLVEPTSAVANPGTCTAGAPADFSNKEPWGRVFDVCAVPSTTSGCASGSSCLSPEVGQYDPGICIRHDQDVACPTGWTKKALSYGSFTDTRACSACGCGAPSNVQCTGGSYKFHDTDACEACTNCSQPVSVAGTCVDLANHADNNQFSLVIEKWPTPSGGTCAATGGTAVGEFTPGGAETWCCK